MSTKKLPERPEDIPEVKEGWTYVGRGNPKNDGGSHLIAVYSDPVNGWIHGGSFGCMRTCHYAVHKDAPDEIWQRFGFTGNPMEPKEDPLLKEVLGIQQQLAVQEGLARGARQDLSVHLTNHYGQGVPLAGNPGVLETLERAKGILHAKPATTEVPETVADIVRWKVKKEATEEASDRLMRGIEETHRKVYVFTGKDGSTQTQVFRLPPESAPSGVLATLRGG